MPASCLCSAPHTPHTPPLYFTNTFLLLFPLPLHLPWPGDIDMSFLGCTAGRSFFTLANTRFMAHTHTRARTFCCGCFCCQWLHFRFRLLRVISDRDLITLYAARGRHNNLAKHHQRVSLSLSHSPSPWPALLLIMAVPNDCATPTYAQEIGFLSSSAVLASV